MKLLKFLTLTAAALLLFSSCTGGNPAEGAETTAAETEETAEIYTVVAPGVCNYTFIRADVMGSDALKKTLDLRRSIEGKFDVLIKIESDWSRDNKENNTVESTPDVREFLIGNTNRAETRALAEEYKNLGYGYVIKAVNGKIVIWATEDAALTAALNYFGETFLGTDTLEFTEGFTYVWSLNGEGMPLTVIANEYSIICPQKTANRVWNASDMLALKLEELSGTKPNVESDTKDTDKTDKEILIGSTDRPESAIDGIGYMDYVIRIKDDKIVLFGGSPLATQSAVEKFISIIKDGTISTLDGDFEYKSNYHELIADSLALNIESFVPVWADKFTPAAWMLDYEEKLYALTAPSGRMTSDSHRGDVQNYPENSIPGILSAIMMGADVIEIDIRLTKDNIMVLMHDASLKRTTDWSAKAGKNGLPASEQIEDWTYEQLRELRLLYGGKATDCIIPTMYEAALLFAGRAQIHFDCKVSDQLDKNSDIYLLAEATGSKESFIYYYGLSTMQQWKSLNKDDAEFSDFIKKMSKYLAMSGHGLRKRNFDMIEKHGDHANGWEKAWDEGYKMTFTNKIYDFCKYIAANEGPIPLP